MASRVNCKCGAVVYEGDGEVSATLPFCAACAPTTERQSAEPEVQPAPPPAAAPSQSRGLLCPPMPPRFDAAIGRVGDDQVGVLLIAHPVSAQITLPIDVAEQYFEEVLRRIREMKGERIVLAGAMPKVPIDPIVAERMRRRA